MLNKQFINKHKLAFVVLITVNAIALITLIALCLFKKIGFQWITGDIIAIISGLCATYLKRFSVVKLVNTENPYYFYFLFLIRVGVYAVPFLISIYLENIFSIYGVLLGIFLWTVIPFFDRSYK